MSGCAILMLMRKDEGGVESLSYYGLSIACLLVHIVESWLGNFIDIK